MFYPSHFDWDPQKAGINERKHGFTFVSGARIFLDSRRVEWNVSRAFELEQRWKAVGRVENILLVVVFTMRGDTCRIISVRRTNKPEERRYADRSV